MEEFNNEEIESMLNYIVGHSRWFNKQLRTNIAKLLVNELQDCPERSELIFENSKDSISINLNKIAEKNPRLIFVLHSMCERSIAMLSQKHE